MYAYFGSRNGGRIFPKPVPSVVKFRVVHPCNLFTLYIWRAPPLARHRPTLSLFSSYLPWDVSSQCSDGRRTGRLTEGPNRGKYSSEAGADRCSTTASTAAHPSIHHDLRPAHG